MGKKHKPTRAPWSIDAVSRIAQENTLIAGFHLPTLLVEGSQQMVAFPVEMKDTYEQRMQQMYTVGASLGQRKELGRFEQVFLISEGWISRDAKLSPSPLPPSQDPNRVEVLLISSLNRKGQNELRIFEMIRAHSGTLIDFLKLHSTEEPQLTAVYSPFLEALKTGFETSGITN